MKLLTKAIEQKLIASGLATQKVQGTESEPDHEPVVKFFNPCGSATWLITEIVPDSDGDTLFGLCDLGMGFPELGYVSLTELRNIRLRFGLGIERDTGFRAKKTIGEYASEARQAQEIKA